MSDAGSSHAEDKGDQSRAEDHADSVGLTHPARRGQARLVREYRMSRGDRVCNAIFSLLA